MNLGLPKSYIDSLLNPLILINISNEYLFRDIKTPNHEFFSVQAVEKKIIAPNLKKTCFVPIKSLFSFSNDQPELNS